MHAFSEEQEAVREVVRRSTTSRLETRLDVLEAGEPPYELMRERRPILIGEVAS